MLVWLWSLIGCTAVDHAVVEQRLAVVTQSLASNSLNQNSLKIHWRVLALDWVPVEPQLRYLYGSNVSCWPLVFQNRTVADAMDAMVFLVVSLGIASMDSISPRRMLSFIATPATPSHMLRKTRGRASECVGNRPSFSRCQCVSMGKPCLSWSVKLKTFETTVTAQWHLLKRSRVADSDMQDWWPFLQY